MRESQRVVCCVPNMEMDISHANSPNMNTSCKVKDFKLSNWSKIALNKSQKTFKFVVP